MNKKISYAKLWANWREYIEPLSEEARGRLFTAVLDYINTGEEPVMTGEERFLFPTLKSSIERDIEKYRETSQIRSEAGKKGGRPKKQIKQMLSDETNAFAKSQERRIEEKNIEDITPYNPPKGETRRGKETEDDQFSRFWSAYPRHVGKAVALKAWQKLKPDKELINVIIQAIENQKCSDQWQRDGGQYIPHPATWLNGRRWEDELTSSSNGRMCIAKNEDNLDDLF